MIPRPTGTTEKVVADGMTDVRIKPNPDGSLTITFALPENDDDVRTIVMTMSTHDALTLAHRLINASGFR